MKCPVCENVTLLISHKNGIEIDYCPECRGIWLDRGELDKIVERARLEEQRYDNVGTDYNNSKFFEDHRYDKDIYHGKNKRKKRSMFSDIMEMFGED